MWAPRTRDRLPMADLQRQKREERQSDRNRRVARRRCAPVQRERFRMRSWHRPDDCRPTGEHVDDPGIRSPGPPARRRAAVDRGRTMIGRRESVEGLHAFGSTRRTASTHHGFLYDRTVFPRPSHDAGKRTRTADERLRRLSAASGGTRKCRVRGHAALSAPFAMHTADFATLPTAPRGALPADRTTFARVPVAVGIRTGM